MQLHDRRWHQWAVIIYRDPHNYTKREKSFLFEGLNFIFIFFSRSSKTAAALKVVNCVSPDVRTGKKKPKGEKK